jgi:hypothetical protein
MSKLLAKLRSDPRVDEVCVEQGMCDHRASYFVHLKLGWVLDQTGEAHCFGEDTLRDVQRTMKRVVPCECAECCGESGR